MRIFSRFPILVILFFVRWRGSTILDDVVEEIDAKTVVVRNTLRLPNLQRSDHGAALTCKAANTNLTQPVETTVKVNMVCKYRKEKDMFACKLFITEQM